MGDTTHCWRARVRLLVCKRQLLAGSYSRELAALSEGMADNPARTPRTWGIRIYTYHHVIDLKLAVHA